MKAVLRSALLLALISCKAERYLTPDPARGNPVRGKELLLVHQCYDCHIIPGIDRKPGPGVPTSLAGLATRPKLAVNQVENTRDNLEAYIQHPRKVFERSNAPGIGEKPAEARDMAAYLVTLD